MNLQEDLWTILLGVIASIISMIIWVNTYEKGKGEIKNKKQNISRNTYTNSNDKYRYMRTKTGKYDYVSEKYLEKEFNKRRLLALIFLPISSYTSYKLYFFCASCKKNSALTFSENVICGVSIIIFSLLLVWVWVESTFILGLFKEDYKDRH